MFDALHDLIWAYQDLFYGLGVNAILALSMYAVVALGQLSLGQAAFMGVGAYVGAVFTVKVSNSAAMGFMAVRRGHGPARADRPCRSARGCGTGRCR